MNTAKQIIDRLVSAIVWLMLLYFLLLSASYFARNAADVWQVEAIYEFQEQKRQKHQAEAPRSLFVPDENTSPNFKAPENWQ